jgi:F-box protein, helicase, 18
MSKPTQEQIGIVNWLQANDGILAVNAGAGTGKTSTSQLIVAELKPKKAFYTAFNKSIVLEASEKFPSSVECKTQHAFALKYVKPKKKIEDFTYLCIKEKLSYPVKRTIIDVMGAFFRSDSTDMYEFIQGILEDEKLTALACSYIEKMIEGKINPTFDFLLKYLHLCLHEGIIAISYDLVIVDECQDVIPVTLAIFQLIDAPKKLLIGDTDQNIYAYMNTVNAFDLLDVPILPLTKSFRCSPEIASRVERFGKLMLRRDFTYTGTETKPDDTVAYISRTNASIISRMAELHEEGISYSLTRKIDEIFAMPLALVSAASGREVYSKKYKYLEKEYKNYTLSNYKSFYTYLNAHVDDQEIKNAIKLLSAFREKGINIFEVREKAKKVKPNPNIWVVTAHSFKGRETSTVHIEDDLNTTISDIVMKGGPENGEDTQEVNLAYVATTRCKNILLNCKFL